jgi:phage repressor protein C with HTH and peptisase S24 domain
MEPEFCSGDMVYVKYTNTVSPGDIAVAWWTGGMVIKQVGWDRKLHSINKAYPFGDRSEDDHVRVIGKVMGKVEEGELPSEREQLLINDAFSEEISAFNRQYAD